MQLNKTLLLATIVISTTFVSCKKDYTCNCTATVNVPMFGPTSTNSSTNIKATKKNATKTCDDAENQLKSEVGTDGTASCELK